MIKSEVHPYNAIGNKSGTLKIPPLSHVRGGERQKIRSGFFECTMEKVSVCGIDL